MITLTRRYLALGLCVLLASCGDALIKKNLPPKPESRGEAAGILISVNSVTPWNQVSGALQPKFTISGDTAIAQIAPTTEKINEQVLKAFGIAAGIGLPQTSTQSSNTNTAQTSSQTGSTATSQSTSTDTKQPGTAPQVPSGTPAGVQALSHTPPGGSVDIDPILKYQAALSLYQAVTLMNQQIHSAVSNKCYTPYLVQMKIAVMPYSEYLPFDLHSRISFFPDLDQNAKTRKKENAKSDESKDTKPVENKSSEIHDGECKKGTTPLVVPVLVTDDIEKAIKQNALETSRQIGFAVGGLVSGVAANMGVNKLNQSIRDSLGQDINSRFTVSRLIDNTIYVRIGAANQASYGKSLMGQTYDLALILLVPNPYSDKVKDIVINKNEINVVSTSEFRDIETNAILQNETRGSLLSAADRVFQDMGSEKFMAVWNSQSDNQKLSIIKQVLNPVTSGDYLNDGSASNFESTLETITIEYNGDKKSLKFFLDDSHIFLPLLWARLTALAVNSPFKTASFELPITPRIEIPNQTVLLEDNMDDSTTATLRNISGITDHSVNIELTLNDSDRKRDYRLPATSVQPIDFNANTLSFSFPSLAKLGIANFSQESSRLTVTPASCPTADCPRIKDSKPGNESLQFPLLYFADDAKLGGATFDFTSRQAAILTVDGKASATVLISNLKGDAVSLSSDNADIESATDGQGIRIAVADGKVKILQDKKPQAVNLQFKGVTPQMQINLTASGEKKGADAVKKIIRFVAVAK